MDECDEKQIRQLLNVLEDMCEAAVEAGTELRACLASRHYPHITIKKGLRMTVEGSSGHDQDIRSYADKKLRLDHKQYPEQFSQDIFEKASGIFMWVVLVVDILNEAHDQGKNVNEVRERLKEPPSDLHELVRDILTGDQKNRPGLLLCIQWVLFATRPLTPEELLSCHSLGDGRFGRFEIDP